MLKNLAALIIVRNFLQEQQVAPFPHLSKEISRAVQKTIKLFDEKIVESVLQLDLETEFNASEESPCGGLKVRSKNNNTAKK